jgi:hypothetical protein
VIVRKTGDAIPAVLQPLLGGRSAIDCKLTAYFCERGACGLPVTGSDAVLAEISRLALAGGGV